MCLGKSKKIVAAAVLIASGLFFSSSSYAAPSCSSFLDKNDDQSEGNNPLEEILDEIKQAKTLDEANKLTYALVTMGNNVFDTVIDGIIALNNETNQEAAEQQTEQIQMYVNALQNAFKIPSYVMNFAISNRLDIESAETQQKARAVERKEPIGFIEPEQSSELKIDPQFKQPVGFALKNARKSGNRFFRMLIEQFETNAIEEKKVAAEKEAAESPTIPIGFVPPKENAKVDNEAPLETIGFVQPEKVYENVKRSDVVQVILNVQAGEFRVIDSQKENPVGFQ